MLLLLFLFFGSVWGKQNFEVEGLNGRSTSQALSQCFTAGLCTTATGCCNGHGVCKANSTTQWCSCGVPLECRSGLTTLPSYSGTTCATVAIDSGCCKDGSDDLLFAQSGVCNKRTTGDAETGAKGRLLQRLGNANYNDSYGSFQDSLSQIFNWQSDLLSGSVAYTKFNMMGLAFFQVALKDVVHLDYYPICDQNITFNGTTYPKIRWQNNTGVSGSPKQFENTATAVVDAGPVYDYATKVGSGPYLDITPAVTYWTNTHHMTTEFILGIKFLGLYHNYVAANVEDYFCGAHSTNTSTHNNTCTIPVSKQYELARRSVIRFFQLLLQTSVLNIALENPTNINGLDESYFYNFWWRDHTDVPIGWGYQEVFDKVRTGAEFADGININLQHHAISALDFFISARNPNINTTAYAYWESSSPCGYNPATITYPGGSSPAQIIQDVFNHFHTPTQGWGSRIASTYAAETALLLYRANELGLNSYKDVISSLTDSVSSSDLTTHVNVFYGVHKDSNTARKYSNTTAFVAIAANIVAINDVIMTDRTGHFQIDEQGIWISRNYHPDPSLISSPDYEFANCYKGGGSECTLQAWRGAQALTGQWVEPLSPSMDGYNWQWFTRGALNAAPTLEYVVPNYIDSASKPNAVWPLLAEIINPLFYHFDGVSSMALRFSDSQNYFLPNVVTDSFPSAIAWSGYLDGTCWQQTFIQGNAQYGPCSRARTFQPSGECFYFPGY